MKIRPVILCGGAGTRLWPNLKNTQAKQFIDFGGWSLLQKAFERINNNSYLKIEFINYLLDNNLDNQYYIIDDLKFDKDINEIGFFADGKPSIEFKDSNKNY